MSTWQDRAYETIPADFKGSRTFWHATRLIEAKYPNPRKCPKAEADVFHYQAVELVKREDFAKEGSLLL